MARSDPSARSTRRAAAAGLTLTELLIYLLLAGVLTAAAASLVVSHVRTSRNLELRQRAVDLYGRINHLLQLEISEGREIRYNQPLPAACGPGAPLFTVIIPSPFDLSKEAPPSAEIHYYSRNNGNDLWRCGPSIDEEGFDLFNEASELPNPHFDALVNTNTRLEYEDPPDDPARKCDSRAVCYWMIFYSPDGQQEVLKRGSKSQPLIARTGVHLIE